MEVLIIDHKYKKKKGIYYKINKINNFLLEK